MLRIDDIPQQVVDDIHASGVIWRETLEMFTKWWYNEAKKCEKNQKRKTKNEKDIRFYC